VGPTVAAADTASAGANASSAPSAMSKSQWVSVTGAGNGSGTGGRVRSRVRPDSSVAERRSLMRVTADRPRSLGQAGEQRLPLRDPRSWRQPAPDSGVGDRLRGQRAEVLLRT